MDFLTLFLVAFLSQGISAVQVGSRGNPEAKLRTIGFLCKLFCKDTTYNYLYDDYYDFWRNLDYEATPRIFCGLCQKTAETTTHSTGTSASGQSSSRPEMVSESSSTGKPTESTTKATTSGEETTTISTTTTTKKSRL